MQDSEKGSRHGHTLSDDAADETQAAKVIDCPMSRIRPSFMQVGPSEKASRPVSLPGFMIADKLIIINRSIGFVQRIGPSSATIIGQARGYR